MENSQSLPLSWMQGYNGGPIHFIDEITVCFLMGKNVKFINSETKDQSYYAAPVKSIGKFAVSKEYQVFAYSNICINPCIRIVSFPGFEEKCTISDMAKLEISAVAFSTYGTYISFVTGVPDFIISVWDWTHGIQLCSTIGPRMDTTRVTFDPLNWHNLCSYGPQQITMWNVEQANDKFLLSGHNITLPASDEVGVISTDSNRYLQTRQSARVSSAVTNLSKSVRDILAGTAAKSRREQKSKDLVTPVSHCWSAHSNVYIGCKGGQLIMIDAVYNSTLRVLINPHHKHTIPSLPTTPLSKPGSAASIKEPGSIKAEVTPSPTFDLIGPGAFNCLSLHKEGLYAGGKDGAIRTLDVALDHPRIVDQMEFGREITSLSWSRDYEILGVGSKQGTIHLVHNWNVPNATLLLDHHYGNFVGLECLYPECNYCATVRADGTLQLWAMEEPFLVATCFIGCQATCFVSCPSSHTVAIGSQSGHLFIVDVTEARSPRIIHRIRIYQNCITALSYDDEGKFLLAGSNDGNIIVLNAYATAGFSPCGCIAIAGEITAISAMNSEDQVLIAVLHDVDSKTVLTYFSLSDKLFSHDNEDIFANKTRQIKDSVLNKVDFKLSSTMNGLQFITSNVIMSFDINSKELKEIELQRGDGKKIRSNWKINRTFICHQLPTGGVYMCRSGKLLITWSKDGCVGVWTLPSMTKIGCFNCHDYNQGGITTATIADHCQQIITIGDSGSLCSWKLDYSDETFQESDSLQSSRVEQDKAVREFEEWWGPISASEEATPDALEKDLRNNYDRQSSADTVYCTPTPIPTSDHTWLEKLTMEIQIVEDKKYNNAKRAIRISIRDLRKRVRELIVNNEELPKIDKLEHHEFTLDLEERQKLIEESDKEVELVRKQLEFRNLAKKFHQQQIITECWESMQIVGKAIHAFKCNLQVCNYPMRRRNEAELAEIAFVTLQRKIEVAESTLQKEIIGHTSNDITADTPENRDDEEAVDTKSDADRQQEESVALYGSRGASYGGENALLYSQFQLHTVQEKRDQIVLLKDCIYNIKSKFNEEFKEVMKVKQSEIKKIKEKNKRIRKIMQDLKLEEDVFEPIIHIDEEPEKLLKVYDHEIKAQVYRSPEEEERIKTEKQEERQRKLAEEGQNPRDRALNQMMGGRLEANPEEDLFKELIRPDFMKKSPEEMTDEEARMAKEIEKKEQAIMEEREKYKKALETELKKLQTNITTSCEAFDDRISKLFEMKIKTDMVICQEELKCLRLYASLIDEDSKERKENELSKLLDYKKQLKNQTLAMFNDVKHEVELFREEYDRLVTDDKLMDKGFRKEFADTEPYLDTLYKLFRRRPRGQRNLVRVCNDPPVVMSPSTKNPYAHPPGSQGGGFAYTTGFYKALNDLDDETHVPLGLDTMVWERLVQHRRNKVDLEQQVKGKALTLAEMEDFLKKRLKEDEELKEEIEGIMRTLKRIRDEKLRFIMNLSVQFLLKQGQVEVYTGDFVPDFSDSILIHRSVIEDLNGTIRLLGEAKVGIMNDCKNFRKNIHSLEWEHKKMRMQIEDLHTKSKDIQMLRVTKELQAYLGEEDYQQIQQREIQMLENTISKYRHAHQQNLKERKRILNRLKKMIDAKEVENTSLNDELNELAVTITEKKTINDVNAGGNIDEIREKRRLQITGRRRLVDKAKIQAQEVAVLRAEVERLRMKTFPALVQVER